FTVKPIHRYPQCKVPSVLPSCVHTTLVNSDVSPSRSFPGKRQTYYIYSRYYNKIEYIRFSSSVGEYVGVTEFGENLAEIWNNDTEELNLIRLKIATYCQHNICSVLTRFQPSVRIKSKTPLSGYDFFPSEINVRWLRDGQEVTSDYYQTHSYLEYTPRSGEKIPCVVEHVSLKEPLITDWEPSSDKSTSETTTMIAIGASILTLGLILLLAGFIFYRLKAS
uniref:Ig-like domain-containing protein n=1 Tax=Neolamprologus brichardi TaxID=32507 RepID=A0A3Q4IB31_NEOBR